MSDEPSFYEGPGFRQNRVQFSFMIGGDNFCFRADTGDELANAIESTLANTERITKAANLIKQYAVANGVLTGSGRSESSSSSGSPSSSSRSDSPPPSGGPPACGCGEPMLDLSHRGFKYKWYADKDRCRNKGKEKQCWGKS